MADLSLINDALSRTGNGPISTLAGSSVAQIVANASYENVVRNELSLSPWKKPSKIEQLNRIDASVAGAPPEPWTAAYQLPPDLIEIRTVKVAGLPIDYEWHGDKIVCHAAADDEVILHYVWRCPESWFPPWLREGIVRRMEAIFLRGIGERYREGAVRDDAATEQLAMAKNRDSQSQTPRDPTGSPTLRARGGAAASGALHARRR